jgi:hypothetical protein
MVGGVRSHEISLKGIASAHAARVRIVAVAVRSTEDVLRHDTARVDLYEH